MSEKCTLNCVYLKIFYYFNYIKALYDLIKSLNVFCDPFYGAPPYGTAYYGILKFARDKFLFR